MNSPAQAVLLCLHDIRNDFGGQDFVRALAQRLKIPPDRVIDALNSSGRAHNKQTLLEQVEAGTLHVQELLGRLAHDLECFKTLNERALEALWDEHFSHKNGWVFRALSGVSVPKYLVIDDGDIPSLQHLRDSTPLARRFGFQQYATLRRGDAMRHRRKLRALPYSPKKALLIGAAVALPEQQKVGVLKMKLFIHGLLGK
jgi:hypothetical protein